MIFRQLLLGRVGETVLRLELGQLQVALSLAALGPTVAVEGRHRAAVRRQNLHIRPETMQILLLLVVVAYSYHK